MYLCISDLLEIKPFKDTGEVLKPHYQPAVSVYAERNNFYAHENDGEFVGR